jgi:hypothetical protein
VGGIIQESRAALSRYTRAASSESAPWPKYPSCAAAGPSKILMNAMVNVLMNLIRAPDLDPRKT